MKTVTGTLPLAFAILLNLIQISSQIYNPIRGNNNGARPPVINNIHNQQGYVIHRGALPAGTPILLDNGEHYLSTGNGPIRIYYTPHTRIARVYQGGQITIITENGLLAVHQNNNNQAGPARFQEIPRPRPPQQ